MLGATAWEEDTDSSRAHGLMTDFQGFVYAYCDTLLLKQ